MKVFNWRSCWRHIKASRSKDRSLGKRPHYTAEWLTWKIPHVLSQSETVSAVLPVAAGSTVYIFLIDTIFLSEFWPIDSTRQVGIGAHSNSQHALLWGREGGVSLSQHSRSTKTRSKMTTTTTTTTNWHCECSAQPIKTDGSAGVRGWNVPLNGMSPGHFSLGWNVLHWAEMSPLPIFFPYGL